MRKPWMCRMPAVVTAGLLLQATAARSAEPQYNDVYGVLGASNSNLVFTPVVPCRVIDTRLEGGRLAAGVPREFDVAGNLSGQGGAPNCAVPDGPATAVVLNFVAVGPVGPGNLRAWPFGQGAPNASVINYQAGVNIANGVVVAICDQASGACTKDLIVRADVSDTHLVVDVLGFFAGPPASTEYTAGTGLTLAGTVFSTNPAQTQSRVAGSCVPGSSIRVVDQSGQVTCEPDDNTVSGVNPASGLLLSAGTLNSDPNVLQRRVSGNCAAGSSIRSIDTTGNAVCEPDDNTVTSVVAPGLQLAGGALSVNNAAVQARVTGFCPSGQSIRAVDAAGGVTCELDTDTTYSPGTGISISGTTISINATQTQARVTETCPSGITRINSNGTVSCGPHIQGGRTGVIALCNTVTTVTFPDPFSTTPSVVLTDQGTSGSPLPPNGFCVVNTVTTTSFTHCCWGSVPDNLSWMAMTP